MINVKCRFFVVPGNCQALLKMPDIELFGFIRIMSETIGDKASNKKFDV